MAASVHNWTAEWAYREDARDGAVMAGWPGPESAAHIFHQRDLLDTWRETIGAAGNMSPAVGRFVHDAGAIVHLACVVSRQSGRLLSRRILEPMGQDLFAYHDPCVERAGREPIDWNSLWKTVRATAPGHTDQALFRFVQARFAGTAFGPKATDESPVLTLTGCHTLHDVLARCSANHRGDVKRRLRRLAERGTVELKVFSAATQSEAQADFAERYWPVWVGGQAGQALHTRPGFRDYCERILSSGLAAGWGDYVALTVDDEPIAWHFGLADRGRLYWWMPVVKPEWEAYSPGKVLLASLIERMTREGWTELHFQTGSQPYKMAWKPDLPPLAAVRWHASNLRARLISTYDRVAATT